MEEMRKEQRFNVGLRSFAVQRPRANKPCGKVEDFSLSGISFDADEYFPNTSELSLDLKLAGLLELIPIKVKIIWGRASYYPKKYIYGALILSIEEKDKLAIIERLSQDWKNSIPTDNVQKVTPEPDDEVIIYDPLQ